MRVEPSYLELHRRGALAERIQRALVMLAKCSLCPLNCGVNRLEDARGVCRTGRRAAVASAGPHFGEEAPLVGRGGSGTIFIGWCNLRCRFCQNYTISQMGEGRAVTSEQLASMMLHLQSQGCHNINFVSPTHVVPQVLEALLLAVEGGLRLPLVYNTGGYDSVEALRLLEGIVDIYMPDMKYSDDRTARRLSGVKNYPTVNRAAVKEMHRQVGDLLLDEEGVAFRGLLVRHLVLPHDLAGTEGVLAFLAQEVSRNTYLNLMGQYRPCYRVMDDPQLGRPLSRKEYQGALDLAASYGMRRLDRPRVWGLFALERFLGDNS